MQASVIVQTLPMAIATLEGNCVPENQKRSLDVAQLVKTWLVLFGDPKFDPRRRMWELCLLPPMLCLAVGDIKMDF